MSTLQEPITDRVIWSEARCTWNTTTMLWNSARTHDCGVQLSGGSYIPYPVDYTESKKKRYIKLICTLEDFKKIETKEVKEDIKVTLKNINILIQESLIKLNIVKKELI